MGEFFSGLWAVIKPTLITLLTLGFNWVVNYFNAKKDYAKYEGMTQDVLIPFRKWKKIYSVNYNPYKKAQRKRLK